MNTATKTRSQRRMEKKQALILLVVALVVSLASFTLGVVVGRQGAERDLAQKFQETEKILLTQVPSRQSAKAIAAAPATGDERSTVSSAVQVNDPAKLTFYENLGKEDTAPLGSGINLPPVPKVAATPQVLPPLDLPDQPIVKTAAVPVSVAKKAPAAPVEIAAPHTGLPKSDPQGGYAVQVGSFATAGDAGAFKQRLLDRGLPAFVVEADLGKKGLWYRVRLGPYADAAAAKQVQQHAEKAEKIKGFISRQ